MRWATSAGSNASFWEEVWEVFQLWYFQILMLQGFRVYILGYQMLQAWLVHVQMLPIVTFTTSHKCYLCYSILFICSYFIFSSHRLLYWNLAVVKILQPGIKPATTSFRDTIFSFYFLFCFIVFCVFWFWGNTEKNPGYAFVWLHMTEYISPKALQYCSFKE